MTKEWNDRNERFGLNGWDDGESFEEHNRRMEVFRGSHAKVAMVNGSRDRDLTLLISTRFLQVPRTVTETGESAALANGVGRSTLIPPRW